MRRARRRKAACCGAPRGRAFAPCFAAPPPSACSPRLSSAMSSGRPLLDGFVTASADAGLRLETIEVRGRAHTPKPVIIAASELTLGEPMLTISLPALHERLSTIGWIRTVAVERRMPSTIRVEITERVPMALLQTEDGHRVIDETGTVIAGADPSAFGHLTVVAGSSAARQRGADPEHPAHRAGAVRRGLGRHLPVGTPLGRASSQRHQGPASGNRPAHRLVAARHHRPQQADHRPRPCGHRHAGPRPDDRRAEHSGPRPRDMRNDMSWNGSRNDRRWRRT